MSPIFNLVFVFVTHFLSLFHSVLPNSVERVALFKIKSQITHDPYGVLKSWNESLPTCEWHGVYCGIKHPYRHRVVNISLPNYNLVGTLSPYVGNLSFLRILFLTNNSFGGQIPPQIGNLVNLRVLGLEVNRFEGQIPANISRCLNLIELGFTLNNLSGIVPSQIGLLPKLELLTLDANKLEGDLLNKVVVNLTSLRELYAIGNAFHGSIPDNIGAAHQYLYYITISSNSISGKFMFNAKNIPSLKALEVCDNYMGGGEADDLNFLQTLLNCSNLKTLEFGGNRFGGMLPKFLGNLSTTLTNLDFQQNRIYGSIPSGLFNLINLRILVLQGNQMSGHLSPQIERLTKLEIFYLYDNYFTGKLPISWGNMSHLSWLYLNNNKFEGSIPTSLGNCTNLLYLVLSQNNLSGTVPPQLFHASSMLVNLYLDHNQLKGTIPVEIGQLNKIVDLDVSENALSGEFPTTLSSCISLDTLMAGGNLFTGSIPQSFKSLANLNFLNLSHNELSGTIPQFLANFPLFQLDLSYNNFEGEVPKKGVFANRTGLTILVNNKLCGGISELHLPPCPSNPTTKRKRGKLSVVVKVIIAVASLVVGLSILSFVYFLLCSRRRQNKLLRDSELNLVEPFPKVSYDMLLKATDRFSETNLLGEGRFGSVYKGILDPESNMVVAIKVISLEQRGATKSFMAECEALRSIRHRNLLKIVTVCSSTDFQGNDFKALVYEFMTNGNLHQWIHTDPNLRTLSLLQRVEIAIDVASALDYLHNDCVEPIIHCDLKPSNILLDDDMVAHVGDFGLARFHLRATANNSSSVAVKGTVGYAAPEYGVGSMVSKEGDVYSYCIVLLELMTSKNPTDRIFEGGLDLHNYGKSATMPNQLINIIDPRLLDNDVADASEGNEGELLAENERKMKCIRSVVEIGVKCSVESPQDRMKIEDVIGELQVTRDVLLNELHIIRARHIRDVAG